MSTGWWWKIEKIFSANLTLIVCRDSKKFSAVDNKTQEMITGQLIDINIDFNESSTPVNFNNNSLLTSTNLVTSDSPESKGK